MLSVASRAGAVLTNLTLGGIVTAGYSWQVVFVVAASILGLDVLINWCLLYDHAPPQMQQLLLANSSTEDAKAHRDDVNPLDDATLCEVWMYMMRSSRFIAIATAIGLLCVVSEFVSFIPLLLVETAGLPKGQAAQYAAVYTVGMTVSALVGGVLHDKLGSVHRGVYLTCCTATATLCMGVICVWVASPPMSPAALSMALFVMGAGVAPPYFLPGSVFALKFGGRDYCGTVSAIIDGCGYFSTVVFQLTSGWIIHSSGWVGLFRTLTMVSACATVAMAVFSWLECREERRIRRVNDGVDGDAIPLEHQGLMSDHHDQQDVDVELARRRAPAQQ